EVPDPRRAVLGPRLRRGHPDDEAQAPRHQREVRRADRSAVRLSGPVRKPEPLVVPPASTYVDRWSLAPPGKDADPQESLWDFKWSRTPPGGDQRPRGGVRTCRRGH